jgi:hypothetical protein
MDELILPNKGFRPAILTNDKNNGYAASLYLPKHIGDPMYRLNVLLVFALAIAMIANVANPTIGKAAPAEFKFGGSNIEAQGNEHVGVVIAYLPGQSITIMDRDGNQLTFELAPSLKIVPPQRASALAPGVYVTIIAPNNVPGGKQIAVGIVIHPGIPEGFPVPSQTSTPLPTQTLITTETATSTETPTGTVTVTETPTPTGTITVTAPSTETPTPTATPGGTSAAETQVTSLLDALRAFLLQILSR